MSGLAKLHLGLLVLLKIVQNLFDCLVCFNNWESSLYAILIKNFRYVHQFLKQSTLIYNGFILSMIKIIIRIYPPIELNFNDKKMEHK